MYRKTADGCPGNARVEDHEWPAIRLYERRGYERVGEWSRYYQDGESALVMEKRKITF